MPKLFQGHFDEKRRPVVTVNGEPLKLYREIRNHSAEFNWGYGGSGPSQLALAILCEVLPTTGEAHDLHQDFKWRVTARLPEGQPWELTEERVRSEVAAILDNRPPPDATTPPTFDTQE